MVAFRHAKAAETAVLRSRRLDYIASVTCSLWPKENVIVWIIGHACSVISLRDVVLLVRDTEIREDVGKSKQWRDGHKQPSR